MFSQFIFLTQHYEQLEEKTKKVSLKLFLFLL